MTNNLKISNCSNTTLSNSRTDHRAFFTIVIPAYNLENYICDCIRSIQRQSFDDFECIIVDDGSTDRTAEVIKESIENDPRFRLISILHGGPQKAKNAGMNVACGEYICFMDGDDTLESGCLTDCREKAEGCDMLIFGINYQQYVNRELVSEKPVSLKPMEFASGAELADWYIENRKLLIYSNANKFYRKKALESNHIRFREEISFGEDRLFNYVFLNVCQKICVLPGVYYNYRAINSESSTHSFRHYFIDELLNLHEEKIHCFCKLSKKTSTQAREKFRKIDYDDSFYMALSHIREHIDELSPEEYADEMEHLESGFIQSVRTDPHRFVLEHAWRSKEKRIHDFAQQIKSFKDSDAMQSIIEVLNEAALKTEGINVLSECEDIYSFLAQFGVLKGEYFRSFNTEAAFKINRLIDDRREELYQAFVTLGFFNNNKPSFERYDYILISGGANDANRLRTLKAKEILDELIRKGKKPKMIAGLSTGREIFETEHLFTDKYAEGLHYEYEVLSKCIENELFTACGNRTDKRLCLKQDNEDPTLRAEITEYSEKYCECTVRNYCAPKRNMKAGRADTFDCLEFFLQNTEIPKESNILLVINNNSCMSNFPAEIGIEYGLNVDIVGNRPDEDLQKADETNCVSYINKLIRTYAFFNRFEIRYRDILGI